jgi:methylisocitrate lyase
VTPTSAAADFRAKLTSGRLLRFPGAINPLSAVLIEELRFDGVYVSGAVVAADLALPDIGLTTLTEVVNRAEQIARVTRLPVLVDADTGFGGPVNIARTVQLLTRAGVAGCHIEDQQHPKRCGHLEGKTLVTVTEMLQRIRAAVTARPDPDFVICARTDARTVEGLDAAIDRAKAYVDAGADLIFAEALADEAEIARFRAAVDAPLLINMTEFGRTTLLPASTLATLGVNVVIYPVTLFRVAMGAVERALATIAAEGTQMSLLEGMQTRQRLYELVRYRDYAAFDADIYTFTTPTTTPTAESDSDDQ